MSNIAVENGLTTCVVKRGRVVKFEKPVRLEKCQIDGTLKIGAYTYIRGGCIAGLKEIGRFCSIAPGVTIGGGQHPTDFLSTHPFQYKGTNFSHCPEYTAFVTEIQNRAQPLAGSIGSDVWIGANVTILRGVNIGDGAIIGTGAVVTRDVHPYEIVAGVPAKVIRLRFPPDIILRLLDLKWWEFTLKSLEGVRFDNILLAVSELERRRAAGLLVPRSPDVYIYQNGIADLVD